MTIRKQGSATGCVLCVEQPAAPDSEPLRDEQRPDGPDTTGAAPGLTPPGDDD